MTVGLGARGIDLVLLDIEGTTTPISFVHDILFPYARARLRAWLRAHTGTGPKAEAVARLREEHAIDRERDVTVPAWQGGDDGNLDESVASYAEWLMDRDRKSPGLKLLQGLIWEDGYRAGELRGRVYDDVPEAMRAWRDAGLRIAIYSSGSELAQRRLFESTAHGDLTPLISAFFDTRTGSKHDPESYRRIADHMGIATERVLFLSDVAAELAAARSAGCAAVLSVRPGNPRQAGAEAFEPVGDFRDIVV